MTGLAIQLVAFDSPRYHAMTRLREDVLRRPLGIVQTEADLAGEETQWHVAALRDDTVVGTLLVKPLTQRLVKFRQMAVAEALHGTGLGRQLVRFTEGLAAGRGFHEVELNARVSVQGFYERLGYRPEGDGFLEIDIPHIKMVRGLGR